MSATDYRQTNCAPTTESIAVRWFSQRVPRTRNPVVPQTDDRLRAVVGFETHRIPVARPTTPGRPLVRTVRWLACSQTQHDVGTARHLQSRTGACSGGFACPDIPTVCQVQRNCFLADPESERLSFATHCAESFAVDGRCT